MDNNRLKFPVGKQKEFLVEILTKNCCSCDQLALILGVSGRTVRDWRREKFTISERAVKKLCEIYNFELHLSLNDLKDNWKKSVSSANQKGGISRYIKYGSFSTLEGCRKGGLNSIKKRYGGLLKPFYAPGFSYDLAEFVGILLGDGGLTKAQWFITVNSIADAEYASFIVNLAEKLFRFKPSVYKRKNCNALVICGSGKKSIEFFIQIGLKTGNKVKQQVGVPEWIIKSQSFRLACLRGLMDTDGGLFRHRYWVNGKRYAYPKICFTNRSMPILRFVFNTLKENKFTPKMITKVENKKVWLYNQHEVEDYLTKVGTHNPRLLNHWRVSRTVEGIVC